MSLFYQITYSTTNNLKPDNWIMNKKAIRYNTRAVRTFVPTLPTFDVPVSFSGDRMLKNTFISSDPNAAVEVNDLVEPNYIANLLASTDVIKADQSLNFNNNTNIQINK